jgi:hypothetical protein
LPKLRVFLIDLAGGKFLSDNDMQAIVFYPLPEFAVTEFFPVDVAQAGIPVRLGRRLSYFDREGGQSNAFGKKD